MTKTQLRRPNSMMILAVTGLALAGLAVTVAAGVSVLAAVMARSIVTPPKKRKEDIRVHIVDETAGTITLQATPDSVLPGEYSFWFSGDTGHARLGGILRSTPRTVVRKIVGVDFGDLAQAKRGRLSGWFYLGPEDLGLSFENVLVQTWDGEAPAWLIPAENASDRWVIQVHGRAVTRQETLRGVPVFREAGYTSLLVSYRNDGDAHASGDGRYGLGDTEWLDVEAAIAFAVGRGAKNIVLMGWSMGGAIVLQTATRAEYRDILVGIVLDSPVVDWTDVVAYQGDILGLPAPIASGAIEVMGQRWGGVFTGQASPIDFDRLDFVTRADELTVPILLMHSDDDGYVPSTGSRALAMRRQDIVTFVPFSIAGHTKLWNYDREGWNSAIRSWLGELAPLVR